MKTKLPEKFSTWNAYYEFISNDMPNFENYSDLKIVNFCSKTDNCIYSFNIPELMRKCEKEKKAICRTGQNSALFNQILFILRIIIFGIIIYLIIKYI